MATQVFGNDLALVDLVLARLGQRRPKQVIFESFKGIVFTLFQMR